MDNEHGRYRATVDVNYDPHAFFMSNGRLMVCPLTCRGKPIMDQSIKAIDARFRATRDELASIAKIIGIKLKKMNEEDLEYIIRDN